MSSMMGNNIRISIFGESHGKAIGITLEGLPPGFKPDREKIKKFMKRRSSSGLLWATKRKEEDIPEIVSGFYNDTTTGTPLCAMIKNTDVRSSDYEKFYNIPRPGHADLTAHARYFGFQDYRGGGHFSGRITAPIVFAGSLCKQILEEKGIQIFSHIASINDVCDKNFDPVNPNLKEIGNLREEPFPVLDKESGEKMIERILEAKKNSDSCGGTVECMAVGMPAGIGDPIFCGVESVISRAMFAIPAVKGVEFGSGFGSSKYFGSQNNDSPVFSDSGESIKYRTNNAGGIEGGITNGMPIICRIAFKPTPSIGKKQDSIDLSKRENTQLNIKGRHDPCIVPRACVVAESMMAIVLLDMYYDYFPGGKEA